MTSSKTGDSGTFERMIRPTITSTMLARNGTRQAQFAAEVHADQEDQVGQQQPDREAGLHDAGVLALGLPGGVLVGHQDRAAPFGAEGQALDDADEDQQRRRQMPTCA